MVCLLASSNRAEPGGLRVPAAGHGHPWFTHRCFPLGRLNVKNEEINEMIKEAPGPINFTVFLTMFGEKLKGADPEETILNAFKVFDPEGKGLKSAYIKEMLMTQGERFSQEEIEQMFAAFPPDMSGNLDYKNLVHVITHGEEKD
ncbi:myosin regulatory light chain 2A, cardiac muscle isoform-like [Amazona ochrocephala]